MSSATELVPRTCPVNTCGADFPVCLFLTASDGRLESLPHVLIHVGQPVAWLGSLPPSRCREARGRRRGMARPTLSYAPRGTSVAPCKCSHSPHLLGFLVPNPLQTQGQDHADQRHACRQQKGPCERPGESARYPPTAGPRACPIPKKRVMNPNPAGASRGPT